MTRWGLDVRYILSDITTMATGLPFPTVTLAKSVLKIFPSGLIEGAQPG